MSITSGIEIRKPDPMDKSYDHHAWSSWKNRYFDMWVGDWLQLNVGYRNLPNYHCDGEYQSIIIPKDVLLRIADDLINRRFDTAPEWAEEIDDLGDYGVGFGMEFKALAEKDKDDEVLVYYWVF